MDDGLQPGVPSQDATEPSSQEAPWREGIVAGETAGDGPPVTDLRHSRAATLIELTQEYAFLAPGLLYTAINLGGREPMADFLQETGLVDQPPFQMQFPVALFQGFERWEPLWNSALYAVPKPTFAKLLPWLGQLTLVDRDLGQVARVRYVDVPVIDALALMRRSSLVEGSLPTLPVKAICLDTNNGCFYFDTPPGQPWAKPRVRFTSQVFPDTRQLAAAVLGRDDVRLQQLFDSPPSAGGTNGKRN